MDEDNNNRTKTTEEHILETPQEHILDTPLVYDSNIQTPYVTVSTQSVARDRTATV